MANPQFFSIENNGIGITSFNEDMYIRIKFRQQHRGTRYYRLRCFHKSGDYAPSDFPVTYIYLGAYKTAPEYNYTVSFKIINAFPSFQMLFETYNYTAQLRPTVVLQSSTDPNFSTYETSSETHLLDIRISGGNFEPIWSQPTWMDTLYDTNAGVRTLTGSSRKGVQGFSVIRFEFSRATGRYNTTIDKYSINISNAFSASYTPQEMAAAGWKVYLRLPEYPKLYGNNISVTFSVEDSRGFIHTYLAYFSVIEYQQPLLTEDNTHRQGGTGSTLVLDLKGKWKGSPLTLICESITAYEQGLDTPHATLTPVITAPDNSFAYTATWEGIIFDPNKSYTINIVLNDTVQTVTISITVTVGIPVIAIRRNRVGINNPDPQSDFDVSGEIFQNGFPILAYRGELGAEGESVDLNSIITTGLYVYKANSHDVLNFPSSNSPLVLLVLNAGGYIIQKVWYMRVDWEFVRNRQGSFTAWKKVTVT